jgi:DnaJ-class molecular chaperone
MARDYYLILGVGSDATPEQIRSAYRREAKRLHPDHSGEGSEPFLAIQEAWEVLGDPIRRRAYDQQLACESRSGRQAAWGPGPGMFRPGWQGPGHVEGLRQSDCPVEPLIPTHGPGTSRVPFSSSSFSGFPEASPRGPWSGRQATRAGVGRGGREIQVEVSLTPEQALYGGRIRLSIPLQMRCPTCRGRGWVGFYECAHCLGSGTVADEWPLEVAFPGGVVDGSVARLPLDETVMGDLSLKLRFRVDAW